MKEAGVSVRAGAVPELSGRMFKDTARSLGVSEEALKSIADNKSELTAAPKAYDLVYKKLGSVFNKMDLESMLKFKSGFLRKPRIVMLPQWEGSLDDLIKAVSIL